jgi:rod shape-determining protein MreC
MLAFIVFFALMGFTLSQREEASWPEKFVNDTISFAQGLIYKPAAYIAGLFEDIRTMRMIYEENKRLKVMAAHYLRDKAQLNSLEEENKRLKEALGFTEKQKQIFNYTYHIANVIAVSSDPMNNTIKIDLGSKHGMKNGMAVMTTEGLVGHISSVHPFSSTVELIIGLSDSNPASKAVAATVLNQETSFGIIESYNKETGLLIMNKIAEDDPLKEGDTIISSGLGYVYPRGIVIGKVVSRQVGDFGLTHTAFVEPAADFNHWNEVFVVEVPSLEE